MTVEMNTSEIPPRPRGLAPDGRTWWRRAWSAGSFSRFSGVYVWLMLIVVFGLTIPETFFTKATWIDIVGSQAVTAIVALGLLFPLAAGAYDLSIGQTLGVSAIVSASLVVHGMSSTVAIVIGVALGAVVGLLNVATVVGLRINSFIATLGMSSVLLAVTQSVSDQQQVFGLKPGLLNFGGAQPLGIPIGVFYLAIVALVAWYVLDHTPFGRQLFAIGGSSEAARLAGVRTAAYTAIALVVCGVLAAFGGVVETGLLGAGSPTVGPTYLLPAYAAVFLGATQITPGRFNVPGTLVAVYLLATGVKGLQLAGAPNWVTDLFNGVVLIVAVGLSQLEDRFRLWRRRRPTFAPQS